MSFSINPSIVTDGLIFSYDVGSIQSYKGPAMQNVATGISPSSLGVNTYYNFTSGTEQVYIPTLGPQSCSYVDMYNDYNGGSGSCCPNPFYYGGSLSASPGTVYTYAIVYKSVNRYTHPNFMYHYEYNGASYLTEYGVHMVGGYSGQETHLGDDWYWSRSKFTTNASCNIINAGCWMYQYATYNRLYIAKVLLVQGDYTNLHPKYWPDVGTTRSTTFVDQTKKYTVTPSNIVYSNAGTPSFGESSSSSITTDMPIGSTLPALSSFTLEAWVKVTAWPTNTYTNGYGRNDKAGSIVGGCYYAGTAIRWAGNTSGNGMTVFGFVRGEDAYRNTPVYTVPALNVYNHFVYTNNGQDGGMSLYVNGTLYGTSSPATQQYNPVLVSGCGNLTINRPDADGGGTAVYSYLNGNIDAVKVYNKALTAAEVLNNYNALKGRFGL